MQKRLVFNKTEVAQLLITKKADITNFKIQISCNKPTIFDEKMWNFLFIVPTNHIIINIIFKIRPFAMTKSCSPTFSIVIHPKFIAF